jgi:hypothetical protein
MKTNIPMDIETILARTPAEWVGHDAYEFACVSVGEFVADGRTYTIQAIFDLDTDIKDLAICDDSRQIINAL